MREQAVVKQWGDGWIVEMQDEHGRRIPIDQYTNWIGPFAEKKQAEKRVKKYIKNWKKAHGEVSEGSG